jgi:FkbM family methyltransferase
MAYSQNQEEQIILEYFGDRVGTFLSIGENDGKTFSNVRALAERNWTGVMVEPSPKAFEKLKSLYDGHKGLYIYPFAISGHNGKAMLQESGPLCSAADVGLVSTFHQHEKERFQRSVKYDPIEVKTFRWKTFLNRLKIKQFDFVSIDAEGSDLEILSQMDLSEVKCICLEWNSKPEVKVSFEQYLEGFNLIYTSGENLIYGR